MRLDAERATELQEALEHTKWNLWHGKLKRALEWQAGQAISTAFVESLVNSLLSKALRQEAVDAMDA